MIVGDDGVDGRSTTSSERVTVERPPPVRVSSVDAIMASAHSVNREPMHLR
jgi:hypothetical protein